MARQDWRNVAFVSLPVTLKLVEERRKRMALEQPGQRISFSAAVRDMIHYAAAARAAVDTNVSTEKRAGQIKRVTA